MNDNINLILTRDPDLLLMKEIEKEIHELPESEQTGLKHWVRIVDHIRQPDSVVLSCLRSPEEIEIERIKEIDAIYIKGTALLKWAKFKYIQDLEDDEVAEKGTPYLTYFVSYKWADTLHSDPQGKTLKLIQDHLRNFKNPERTKFWIDFSCLPQIRSVEGKMIERTVEEYNEFKKGLSIINDIESDSFLIHCWGNEAYKSGWCFYEVLLKCFQFELIEQLGYGPELNQLNEGLFRSMGRVQYLYQKLAFRIASHCFRRGHVPDIRSLGFKFADDSDCGILNKKIGEQVELIRDVLHLGLMNSRVYGNVSTITLLIMPRLTRQLIEGLKKQRNIIKSTIEI